MADAADSGEAVVMATLEDCATDDTCEGATGCFGAGVLAGTPVFSGWTWAWCTMVPWCTCSGDVKVVVDVCGLEAGGITLGERNIQTSPTISWLHCRENFCMAFSGTQDDHPLSYTKNGCSTAQESVTWTCRGCWTVRCGYRDIQGPVI